MPTDHHASYDPFRCANSGGAYQAADDAWVAEQSATARHGSEGEDLIQPPRPENNQENEMNVKCNKCGHIAAESEFPKERDLFQKSYIASCPNPECDNRQTPGDASFRMFGGKRPFEYVRAPEPEVTGDKMEDGVAAVFYRSHEAS